jgi:LDH2 family malate/lactate/ureidoglycolate dehydrogenase
MNPVHDSICSNLARMNLIPPDSAVTVTLADVRSRVAALCRRHTDEENSIFIAEKVALAEAMSIPTHGVHYFLHSLWPLLQAGHINDAPLQTVENVIVSHGIGGIGFLHLQKCLLAASDIAKTRGIALAVLRRPGKVGALRVFCRDFMDRGQLIVMLKNTARTVGLAETAQPIFGTNPLCIGLPDTRFIYDASMSTIATNKIRLAKKTAQVFPAPIGFTSGMQPTCDPHATIGAGGFLAPFSFGPYWYKSFFLGIAIEAMAALAGGSTSSRVGEHTGRRLHSKEGMLAVLIDKRAFPEYDGYLEEVALLLKELEAMGLKRPGDFDEAIEHVRVFADDLRELSSL